MHVDINKLRRYEDKGLITLRENPEGDLLIANYTKDCEFVNAWDETTKMCRGLVITKHGLVVARPFTKFFNMFQLKDTDIPNSKSFRSYEKKDGSLGIIFHHKGVWQLTTRGSFTSDQAIVGNEMLLEPEYQECLKSISSLATIMVEIVYPQNRVVCDYGDERSLTLIGVNIPYNQGYKTTSIMNVNWPYKVKEFDFKSLKEVQDFIKGMEGDDEGFVLWWPESDFRMKMKSEEYMRLHRILTRVTTKDIWEALKEERSFEDILDDIPDEFFVWATNTRGKLIDDFHQMYDEVVEDYSEVKKTLAKEAYQTKHPHLVFNFFRSNEDKVRRMIWDKIKPKNNEVFKVEA